MSLLNRCAKLFKQGVDVFLAPAEDPRETFPNTQNHQRNLLHQIEQALIETRSFSKQLTTRKNALEKRLPQLTDKARQALQVNREDLARLALHRRQAYLQEIQNINRQLLETQQEDERLQIVKQKLETQIEAIRVRQQVINARYSAAEAQVRLNESLSGVSKSFSDLGISLEEAEQQANQMQARAEAVSELMETGVLEVPSFGEFDSVDLQLDHFETSQVVEDQLVALKKEIQNPKQIHKP